MIYLDWPGGRSDPYWNDVLLLLPFDGSGQTFVDLGPLSADNAISLIGGGGDETFEQNSGVQLFDSPTLELTQVAGTGNNTNIYINNTSLALPLDTDMCMEWWFYQTAWAAASTPIHGWVEFANAGLIAGRSTPVQAMTFRGQNNGPGETFDTGTYGSGVWRYVAMQYVDADSKVYVYIDGTQVGDYICSIDYGSGMEFFCGDSASLAPTGGASFAYALRIAQMRITAANRYGNVSTIDVPTEPWPTN